MKHIIYIFLFCICMTNCMKSDKKIYQGDVNNYQQENIAEEKSAINIDKDLTEAFPSKDYLESSWFYTLNLYDEIKYDIKIWGLDFYNEKYCFIPLTGGDPPYIEGNYHIVDNKILLKYAGIPYETNNIKYDDRFDDILKEDWELEFTVIDNSLFFSEGLIGKNIIFGRDKSIPKDGEIRIINGHEIVLQRNDDKIKPKTNVRVRIGPGIEFQHCIFEWYGIDQWYVVTSITEYLRAGTPVYIIGHSKNIDTNNDLTGYWYYCWIPVEPDNGGKITEPAVIKNNSGWIFGPLID